MPNDMTCVKSSGRDDSLDPGRREDAGLRVTSACHRDTVQQLYAVLGEATCARRVPSRCPGM
jgi:hypothetical protein